ncbi:MAG: L,D-transpeptidase family protein [Eubacteriales bacterium]|nr:L,D-transpeptidase family protein [Eubacteriales bacterium]
MFKRVLRTAVLTAVIASSISSTAFADVLYAPGIEMKSGMGADSSGQETGISSDTASSASQSGQNAASSGGSGNTSGIIGPGSPAAVKLPGANVSGQGVEEDPILGTAPLINAIMINTDGNTENPFSTNTGAYTPSTDGFSGLWLCYDNAVGDVYYRVFTNEHGWSAWAMNEMSTTDFGDGSKVTAVEIRTKGHTANIYSIYYQATLNDGTKLGWACDGQAAGAFGNGKYITSLEIKLWKRGSAQTSDYQQGNAYEGVITGSDGKAYYSTFDGRAYTGWAYDTSNNKYYFVNNMIVTGWQYIDGYKYYFDENGRVVSDLEPVIGLTGDYKIRINKSMKTMTVYAKDGDNGYIIPVKVILNTVGNDTPVGTFKTYEAYRWKYMHDAEGGAYYCQFLLRFKNGFLLHSVIYQGAADPHKLLADTYNQLGKNQSDGCVRMRTCDAEWVYKNCGVGTEVTIYEDELVPGPLDRPAIEQAIPRTQNYDPTDPVIIEKQQKEAEEAAKAAAAAAEAEAATGITAAPQEVAAE